MRDAGSNGAPPGRRRRAASGVDLLRRKQAIKVCYLPWEE